MTRKMKNKSSRFITFIAVFTFISLISMFSSISNINDGAIENNIETPGIEEDFSNLKTSGSEINITTPENKTYTDPMNGYYPGTYGFEDTPNGDVPIGWTDTSTGTAYGRVIDGIGGHNKVLECNNDPDEDQVYLINYLDPQISGMVEWWWRKDSSQTSCAIFQIMGESSQCMVNIRMDWYADPDEIQYYTPGSTWLDTGYPNYANDKWIHMRVDFDCTSDTYDLWVDQVQYLNDMGFFSGNTATTASRIDIASYAASNPTLFYVDAVGYSWDPNYNVGDNLNEGLLLSFDNSSNLEWMGYSLDEQANKTILGNTTIPMPEVGTHSIQVFGNNSLGTDYQSDIRYFTIPDMITPGAPRIIDMTGEDPALYIIVQTNAPAYLEVISTTTNLVGKGIGTDLTAFYFYNITIFDSSFNDNDSILTSMTIRLYFNPADVKKLDNLKVLHVIYIGSVFSVWETVDITVNEAENYVEFTTTELSVFCLAEVKIPPGKEDNPFLVFLVENMLWIIILAAIGVAVPTIYMVRSKKQKKKKVDTVKKTALEQYKDQEFIDTMEAKAKKKREILEKRTWKPEETTKDEKLGIKAGKKPIKPLKKPKESLDLASLPIDAIAEVLQKREEEIKQTEKEMLITEKLDRCTIHKGSIEGISYVCPKCHAKYCLNCAKTLKQKAETCWVCDTIIKIELEEVGIKIPEIQEDIAGLEPISSAYIDNSFILERIRRDEEEDNMAIFRGLNLTTISEELISKIGQVEMDDEDKKDFIKEILALPPEERDDFVDEILEKIEELKGK